MGVQSNPPPPGGPGDQTGEKIAPGVTREWLAEGRVVKYTLTNTLVDSLEAWAETAIQTMEAWPPDRPYLAIHDVSAPAVILTPHARRCSQRIASAAPALKGRVAVIVPRGALGHLLRIFLNRLMINSGKRLLKAFFSQEEALAWLEEAL